MVITGKNIKVTLVYNDQPYAMRVNSFEATDDGELRKRQHLNRATPETDYVADGWSGDITRAVDGPSIGVVAADVRERQRANLPPRPCQISVTSVYRDGILSPETHTFTGVVFTAGLSVGGRTDDVTSGIKWIASDLVTA